ncbi:MAG: SDR family NAD(P)-dependent oxidoreductase [Solirubrobacterales bacterium]
MTGLSGKVAIITGAAGGLGAAQVARFAHDGATVVATDLLAPGPDSAGGPPDNVHRREQDVTSEVGWRDLVDWTLARFGRLDVLVNNAGYFSAGSIEETTTELMDVHYRVNELGVFLGMAAVVSQMKAEGSGAVVNISSLVGLRGVSGQFAYSASKWAVRGMTKCAALELGPYGIRVNSIHPGLIDTPILAGLDDEVMTTALEMIPSREMGRPVDVAEAVAFLAGDAARYINGAELSVDGGMVL